jgi:hypothetical protein
MIPDQVLAVARQPTSALNIAEIEDLREQIISRVLVSTLNQ